MPAGTEESTADVQVYENTAAMIDTEGKPQAINVGTIVKAGGNWRLIDAPQLGDDGVAEVEQREFFFRGERAEQPELAQNGKPSEEVQRLMEDLHRTGRTDAAKHAARNTRSEPKSSSNWPESPKARCVPPGIASWPTCSARPCKPARIRLGSKS